MDCFGLLATVEGSGSGAATTRTSSQDLIPIDLIWEHITALNELEALMFISFGIVCLFYGWRVYKVLVVISFALIGLVAGIIIGNMMGGGSNPILGVLLCAVLGVVCVPLMRWAVCVLGAVAGGIITASIWYAAQLPEQYIWAGGLVGVVAGGMMSFIVFRVAVMLFSSLGGSALVMAGVLAILNAYAGSQSQVESLMFSEKWFLPAIIVAPTLLGVLIQNKFIKGSQDWTV